MARPVSHYVAEALTLSWLTGPVFDKELRVSSRRRRNYVLRFVYLAALTLFMAGVWMEEVARFERYGDIAMRQARMAFAGTTIIVLAMWFQFIASQLVAIIMCSTSISDEIYSKTLGVMMTTPIQSFQIVLGKILSKLLQIVVLLLISLPLLALVRVMGGVPWEFLWVSLVVSLSSVLFVGSVSMFFSIFNRHAYIVIIETLVTLGVFYLLTPFLFVLISHNGMGWSETDVIEILGWVNPFVTLVFYSESVMRGSGSMPFAIAWWHPCVVLLGASAALLAFSSTFVRRVALRQATGQSVSLFKGRRKPAVALGGVSSAGDLAAEAAFEGSGAIRRVGNHPVLWKELRAPMIRSLAWRLAGIIAILALLAVVYIICIAEDEFNHGSTHIGFGIVLAIFAALCTAIFSSTTITAEKEARSWDILLLTGQSDWQILLGKFVGVLKRSWPFWLLLYGHVGAFVIMGRINPAGLLDSFIISIEVLAVMCASGVFFSSYFRKTTTAVIMNIGLALVIWAIVPAVMAFFVEMSHSYGPRGYNRDQSALYKYVTGNPFLQIGVSMDRNAKHYYNHYYGYSNYWGDGYGERARQYDWPDKMRSWEQTFELLWIWIAIYFAAAWGMLRLAKARMRKRL